MTENQCRHRQGAWIGLLHLTVYYTIIALGFWLFPQVSWPWQLALVWIGGVCAGRMEPVLHWVCHFPSWHSALAVRLNRMAFCLTQPPAVCYAWEHWEHHRYDNSPEDPSTTLVPGGKPNEHESLTRHMLNPYAYSWAPFIDRLTTRDRREAYQDIAIRAGAVIALFAIDPYTTILYWLPATWLVSSFILCLSTFTDHVPGRIDSLMGHSTFVPLRGPFHRLLSSLDLHNISTHLTHHLHPATPWLDLPQKQEENLPEYARHSSPVSIAPSFGILSPLGVIITMFRARGQNRRYVSQS